MAKTKERKKKQQISVRIPQKNLTQLNEIANQKHMSVNTLINLVVEKYFVDRASGNGDIAI